MGKSDQYFKDIGQKHASALNKSMGQTRREICEDYNIRICNKDEASGFNWMIGYWKIKDPNSQ